MFNQKLKNSIESLGKRREEDYERFNQKYWELRHDFDLLLDHLGVHIDDVRPSRVIRKKGGPEKG
jgi:hypothetical protein